jgi:hypothetical protein
MKQLIGGLIMVIAMTTATAATKAEKIEYCYSIAELAETVAIHRNQVGSISKILNILKNMEGGENYESVVLLVYENPNQSPKEVKKAFLDVCLANISEPTPPHRRET